MTNYSLHANTDANINVEKNAGVFAAFVQLLADMSILLIIRNAKHNSRKAFKILRDHYLGSSKPRIISLYSELTSSKMKSFESITVYMIWAETTASKLKTVVETVGDSLLIAMCFKRLPNFFRPFSTVVV